MRFATFFSLVLVIAACATQANNSRCTLTKSELADLKLNVRSFLRDELVEAYTYYDTEDSILDAVVDEDDSCSILIYPAGDPDDGSTLLHGEGKVLFERETLRPLELVIFVW